MHFRQDEENCTDNVSTRQLVVLYYFVLQVVIIFTLLLLHQSIFSCYMLNFSISLTMSAVNPSGPETVNGQNHGYRYFSMQYAKVIVFNREGFQMLGPSQCCEIIWNTNSFSFSWNKLIDMGWI